MRDGSINTQLLSERYGDATAPVADSACDVCFGHSQSNGAAESANCVTTTISKYFSCWKHHGAACAGYLKDWHCAAESARRGETLYITPRCFQDDWLNWFYLQAQPKGANSSSTSDYRFIYCGPAGTWTRLHHDVLFSYSWSTNITGTKLWWLFPPTVNALFAGRDLSELIPTSLAGSLVEWFRDLKDGSSSVSSGNPELSRIVAEAHAVMAASIPQLGQIKPAVVLQPAGQAIFVPSGWYHTVFNLEDTLSCNHNWFNRHNLLKVQEYVVNELYATRAALVDCRETATLPGEWSALCEKVLKLNIGISLADWLGLLTARYQWAHEKGESDDCVAIQRAFKRLTCIKELPDGILDEMYTLLENCTSNE
jgi:hypothetical protein